MCSSTGCVGWPGSAPERERVRAYSVSPVLYLPSLHITPPKQRRISPGVVGSPLAYQRRRHNTVGYPALVTYVWVGWVELGVAGWPLVGHGDG